MVVVEEIAGFRHTGKGSNCAVWGGRGGSRRSGEAWDGKYIPEEPF